MIRILLASLTLALVLGACGRQDASEFMTRADALAKEKKFDEAATVYQQVVDGFPDSPQAPEAAFHLAMLQLNQQRNPSVALTTLNTLVEKHPGSPWGHKALFTVGFTYANELQEFDKAKAAYERYLSQFPDSMYAETVRIELTHLGASPEELLLRLQQSAGHDTTTDVADGR